MGVAHARSSRSRASGVHTTRARVLENGSAATLRRAVPAAHLTESAGLADAPCVVEASRRPVSPSGRIRTAPRCAPAQPARSRHPRAGVADTLRARPRAIARPPLHDAHERRGVLPGSTRLHQLPLPKHGAALAMPAVPRVEYVCGGTVVARQGLPHRGTRTDRTLTAAAWRGDLPLRREIIATNCAGSHGGTTCQACGAHGWHRHRK